MGETLLQEHHIDSPQGELVDIECPHCGRTLRLVLRALEGDPDTISLKWSKIREEK